MKFQHYVPRFYLEQFSNSDGRIWVYDKQLDKTYCTRPENTGGEKYFYDAPEVDEAAGTRQFLENAFTAHEGFAAMVLKRWLRKLESTSYFRIYDAEREIFARFLALQLVRTPTHRNHAIQIAAMCKKLEFRAFLESKFPQFAKEPFEMLLAKSAEPLLHAKSILDFDALEECVSILQRHIWIVTANESGTLLLASDHPVTRHAHKRAFGRSFSGYASQGIQLTFPLSPRFSPSLLERTFHKKFEKLDGRRRLESLLDPNVEHENSLQVRESNRFVFGRTDDFTIAKEMCVQNPKLRDPNRPVFRTSHPDYQNSGTRRVD